MQYDISVWRAFTDKQIPTLGNPAAVVISKDMFDTELMKELARQAQQPMMAFLSMRPEQKSNYDIRYYDPNGRECHICGHATVAATAHLSAMQLICDGGTTIFHLNPHCFGNEDKIISSRFQQGQISLDLFPSIMKQETDSKLISQMARVLGIHTSDIEDVSFSTNVRDYVVSLYNPDVLLRLTPDFTAMRKMAETGRHKHEGLLVTTLAPKEAMCDLYARVFLPITGVNEDIACGSGNCSIVPFWYAKGLNTDTKSYRVIFPFPTGAKGLVGGVQTVNYEPMQMKITIASQAQYEGDISVNLSPVRPVLTTEEPPNKMRLKLE